MANAANAARPNQQACPGPNSNHQVGYGRPPAGVRLSADAVAALLASLLATDSLSEVADTIPLLHLKPIEGRCPMTEATRFWGALSYLLQSAPEGGEFPYYIEVRRKHWRAEISETIENASIFKPWTKAEKSLLAPETEAYDEDAPFEQPGPGIITMAQYQLMGLISAFQTAIGKGEDMRSGVETTASE